MNLFTHAEQTASQKARDAALAQVQENSGDWFKLAMIELEEIAKHGCSSWANLDAGIIGEDIRFMLTPSVGPPHSQNAWGALINCAVKRGWLKHTGAYRQMKSKKAHARESKVYVFAA